MCQEHVAGPHIGLQKAHPLGRPVEAVRTNPARTGLHSHSEVAGVVALFLVAGEGILCNPHLSPHPQMENQVSPWVMAARVEKRVSEPLSDH